MRGEVARQPGRELIAGTASIFVAEALLVPVGILTTAFLTRRFGPAGYGLLALSTVVVVWVESNLASALSRPAIKLVGEARDPGGAASTVLRLYLFAGVALAAAFWLAAPATAALLAEPSLVPSLRLLSLEIPFFCLAQAHRNVLAAAGRFRERAISTAARWVARLALVVALARATGTTTGALAGFVLASVVEVAVCRMFVRPPLFAAGRLRARQVYDSAAPLVASAICLTLFNRLDVIMLKSLGGTAAQVGFYAVAQSLSLLPTLFSFSFAPVLLSTLTRTLGGGDERAARELTRQSMRVVVLLLPVVAATAGASGEIVRLLFGAQFLAAAPLLSALAFAALASVMITVTSCVLTATDRAAWTLRVALPMLIAAAFGHALVIPRAGAHGAAVVTTAISVAGALVSAALVKRLWGVAPHARTCLRAALVAALAFACAALVATPGALVLVKLAVTCALSCAALGALGEFSPDEIAWARSLLRRRRRREPLAIDLRREA
ncbi:MAG TPA: lipopolysaccharide biosynthesis protein [Pyrinomonadaceae bacterium]|jgi:O-antigen/teichoic acid export membrane protein|nr:lipopolysaccharide biosynthesis protein [Pyrinomonadaceae bacterium]